MLSKVLNRTYVALLVGSVLAALGVSAYIYLYAKSYNFIVEAPCDPSIAVCYVRDCSIVDECPPNNLFNYSRTQIKAGDFSKCSDNSCTKECAQGAIACTPIPCDPTVYECSDSATR